MKIFRKFVLAFLVFIFHSTLSFSQSFFPTYAPGGSVSPISLFDMMSPITQLAGPGWWYFVSLLHDQQNKPHSLQVTLIRDNYHGTMYGIGGIGFTFVDAHGQTEYLWNMYPNVYSMVNYPIAPLMSIPASQQNFTLQIKADKNPLSVGFLYAFSHDPANQLRVGQIGAQYALTAQGAAEIGVAQHNPQFILYQLNMTLQDQRGLVPEGQDGFVGTPFIKDPLVTQTWEMAMPNLSVLQWTMTLTPMGKITAASPLQNTVTLTNSVNTHDRIWLDRQVEARPSLLAKALGTVIDEKINHAALPAFGGSDIQPMYHGTWMAFCLDHKPFKNICGEAVAMWQLATPTSQMDSDQNATSGFMNLFTPDSNSHDPIQIGNTLTESLSVSGAQKDLPYRIQNSASGLVQSPMTNNIYDRTVDVTIRKNTLFSALLDQLSGKLNNDSDYVLQFDAISGKTENITFSNNFGYFEGAAIVSLCTLDHQSCQPAGTGFMEQMGYSTK